MTDITKALCLSTSHITHQTAEWLDGDADHILTAWKASYGWFVPCYVDATETELEGWPADLIACRRLAMAKDCDFIRLDADGSQFEELEIWDW